MCPSPGMGTEDVGIRKRVTSLPVRDEGGAQGELGVRPRRRCRSRWRSYVASGIETASVTGASISAGFGFPHVSKVLEDATVGKSVEEAQELPVNPTPRLDPRLSRLSMSIDDFIFDCGWALFGKHDTTGEEHKRGVT